MIPYASRTGTKRNLAGLHRAGWRLMVSAKGVVRTEGFSYALDNGAWHSYANGVPFDEQAFLSAYAAIGAGADFIVLPDIVAGGRASLVWSLAWRARLKPVSRFMLAVQDGMDPEEIGPLVGPDLGIFIGGTTEWKLATMPVWGLIARERSAWLHVGRVNSARRVALCVAAGATSFDGSGPSRFAVMLPRMENARQQLDLLIPGLSRAYPAVSAPLPSCTGKPI